jgi:hypothetical protein
MAGAQLLLEESIDNVLIGSDPACRFCLPLPGVSPIHARIWMDSTGVTVYDTHSPRGLYINDDRVNGQAPLRNGDILWLGTPGEDDVVMIQCRIPPRPSTTASQRTAKALEGDETFAYGQTPGEPAATTVLESDVLQEEPANLDSTTILESDTVLEAVSEPEPVLEVVPDSPPEPAPTGFAMVDDPLYKATRVPESEPSDENDRTMVVRQQAPALPPPPDPISFEDETIVESPGSFPTPGAEHDTHTERYRVPDSFADSLPPPPAPAPIPPHVEPPAEETHVAPPPTPVPPHRPAVEPPHVSPPRTPPPKSAPPAPKAAASAQRSKSGGSKSTLLVAGLVFVVLVLGAGAAAFFLLPRLTKPAVPSPAPETLAQAPVTTVPPATAPPETTAAAPPETTVVPETPAPSPTTTPKPAASPSPAPSASPKASPSPAKATPKAATPAPAEVNPAQQAAAQLATLLDQGEAAAAQHKYADAVAAFDQALKIDASNARATAGKASATTSLAASRKTFVPNHTQVVTKDAKSNLAGFDSADVKVAKAPDYSALIEFEVTPASVKPGDNYSVRIILTNDGKKPLKIGGLTVTSTLNGTPSAGPATPKTRLVGPQQKVDLQEVSGVWADGATSWGLEVVVTSDRGDIFKNQLTWR